MNNSIPIELAQANVQNITYQVLIDMDGSNKFSTDISDDVMVIDYIQSELELKKAGEVLGRPSISEASITLWNDDGKYSPYNSHNIESMYPGYFRRNTKVKILAGFIDSAGIHQTRIMFYGVITDFQGQISNNAITMNLTLKDMAKFAASKKNPNHNYANAQYYEANLFNTTLSNAVSYLLDYTFGTSLSREIHNLPTVYSVIEFPVDDTVWSTIQKLAEACGAKAYFENGTFKFHTPLSNDYVATNNNVYNFTTDEILSLNESIKEEDLINKFEIKSSPKTLQATSIVVGTPSGEAVSGLDEYKNGDSKNALSPDGKTIVLKYQESNTWINTINVPLQETYTYSDLFPSGGATQNDIDDLNISSTIKVWDLINNVQLTIYAIDYNCGIIYLLNPVDVNNYWLQVTYYYYNDRIVGGKYKYYTYSLNNIATNVKISSFEANDGLDLVTCSTTLPSNALYLSDYELTNGNTQIKYRLSNNAQVGNSTYATADYTILFIFSIEGTTVTIGNSIYEFDINSSITAGHIQVDISDANGMNGCALALRDAINNNSGSLVTATVLNNTVTVKSKTAGVIGNNINVSSNFTFGVWNVNTLAGGFDYNGIVYITSLEFSGNTLQCISNLDVISEDADTLKEFENAYTIDNSYILDVNFAKQAADYYLYLYSTEKSIINATTVAMPQIDLGDRVTVTESISGHNDDFIVIGIKHNIQLNGWTTELELQSLLLAWSYDPSRVIDYSKYRLGSDSISKYSYTNPPEITGLSLSENTYLNKSGEVITTIYISFMKPTYPYYAYTQIQMDDGDGFRDLGISTNGIYTSTAGYKAGKSYQFKLINVSMNTRTSSGVIGSITIIGKDNPPSDVDSMNIVQSGRYLKITISSVTDPDFNHYELRYGPTFDSGIFVKAFLDNSITIEAPQEGTLTYWIKAVDNSGNYSANAKRALVNVINLPGQNVMTSRIEDLYLLTLVDCYIDMNGICQLSTHETIDTYSSDFFTMFDSVLALSNQASISCPTFDIGTGVYDASCYFTDVWGSINLHSESFLSDFSRFFDLFGYQYTTVTARYITETSIKVILENLVSPKNNLTAYFRTSPDNSTWNEWQIVNNTLFFNRFVQIKIIPQSLDGTTNIGLSKITTYAYVPDLELVANNISVPITGADIIFKQHFICSQPNIAPFTCTTVGGINQLCSWQITNITSTGFHIALFDAAGNPTAGTLIQYIARGF